MNKISLFAGAALIGATLMSAGAQAQGTPQTVQLVKVDVMQLAAGYRASKVIGATVVNDNDNTIGTIDDLLISKDGREPYAVLQVGGFLGMGTRLVVIPYSSLRFGKDKVILPGGSKEGLELLPEFAYAKD
jgi:hypothetical protein